MSRQRALQSGLGAGHPPAVREGRPDGRSYLDGALTENPVHVMLWHDGHCVTVITARIRVHLAFIISALYPSPS